MQDAYTAVQANPVAHVALGTLQRLVNTLINTSNIAILCSLPYAADYTVRHSDGRQATFLSLNDASYCCFQRCACRHGTWERSSNSCVTETILRLKIALPVYSPKSVSASAIEAFVQISCKLLL